MASEEPGNTETEGEVDTVVFKKKRANRRVSFADVEITSVHIFNRDDDFSEDQPATPNSSHCGPDRELLGFFRDLADSDDSPPNPELDDPPNSFLRPIGSPSPGSSTVGSASAASNDDEDNFFGPVSANFIRPGRLSDSGASDDITMDSTAFSMHFRSLARSDSGGGGNLKTPTMSTAHRLLAFEDSATTPSHNATSTDSASFMVLTKAKKSMVPVDKVSSAGGGGGGNDSNDMSIVGENARSYDYGRISPRLDALLAEGSNILNSISIDSKCIMASEDMHEMPAEAVSLPRTKMSEASGGSTDIPVDQITYDHQIQTPKQLIEGVKEFSENAIEMFRPIPQFTDDNRGTPSNKDGISEFRRSGSDINQKSGERYRSFLEESISLLSSKQQQSFVNTPNSAKHMGIVTPSSKLPGFFSSKESIRHGESLSSLQKSISKFKIPEPSPSSSTLKEGIEKLKRRLSNYSSMPSSFNTVLAGNSKDPQEGHADTHIAHLEEHLCTADLKNEEKNLINIDGDGIETPKNIGNLSQNEVILGLAKDGESPNHTSLGLVSKYKKPMTAAGSPSQFTRSGSKLVQNFSMSENPTEGTLVTSGTDSSSVEITLDYRKNKKVAGMPDNFVSSPVKGQYLSACMEYQDCVSRDLKQLGQYNKLFSGSGQGGDSIQHVNGDSHSSLVADKLDSLLSEMRAESDASFLRTNHVKEFGKVERVLDNNISHLCNESEKFINIQSPLRDKVTMNFQFESTDKNLQAGADPRQFKLYSPRRKNEPSLEKSPSKKDLAHSLTLKESAQSSYRKRPTWSPTSKESTPSPSRQDPSSASHNYVMPPFVGKIVLSPRSSSSRRDNNCHDEVHISQSPFPAQDIDIYSGRKRRNVETAFGDGDHIDKLTKIQRSPKGDKSGGHNLEFMLEHANEVNNEGETIGDDKTRMHWADILVKFLGDTKQLLSGSIDNLNLKAIWLLEDFVARLLKVKKYEILCSEIQSQGKVDPFSSVRHKRVAETRLLLYEIAYKKANLQLMGLKRDILLKRVQQLSSGIQECRVLKLKIEHLSKYGAGDAQIDNSLHQTSLVNFEGMHEACCDEVATRRQEFEDLDRKIESLCKCFHSNCRTKGEPNCANTLALVHDQLKNRMCCRFIRQDLQLWEVDDFERRNGHYDILLNYQGYISQRFTVNTGPLSSIIISNKLNDINILKNFPNMDVGIAFSFLVNAETTKKYVGSRCLAQETQISTSLLSNLLDVVEEVQLTQIEIRNLVQTSFHSPSVNQLDLQLCFIEFYSGGKVTLTLDMTCLNRGVYPSEILPNEIQAATAGPEKSWPQSIIAEIRAAAENLTTGYSRIMRLCRSVSEVVQASSRCMVPGGV